jgi:HK97 gp10 family phage protein
MARNRLKMESRFPQVKRAARDTIDAATHAALTEGQALAQEKLAGSGYNVDPFAARRKDFGPGEGGMVFVHSDQWYYRFLEYGTVFVQAKPFIRPAHRKMRKTFLSRMDKDFEGFVRKRVRRL